MRSSHPHLEIESCSSGGLRVYLEILERTDRRAGQVPPTTAPRRRPLAALG
ncbi:hypothetical protein [Pseudonocardia aurantiaca]|uniref:Glycosyl hydrolase family 36 C-terminal domain-containing protein n=1 Tax=Pseudonocardia aurantiaca TaxID=75290 RepID=A0ABW4FZI4_9PSEU